MKNPNPNVGAVYRDQVVIATATPKAHSVLVWRVCCDFSRQKLRSSR
jgi:hypothetical protein